MNHTMFVADDTCASVPMQMRRGYTEDGHVLIVGTLRGIAPACSRNGGWKRPPEAGQEEPNHG